MASKISYIFFILLFLSAFSIFLHEFYHLNCYSHVNRRESIVEVGYLSHRRLIDRKVDISSTRSFDFTPFYKHSGSSRRQNMPAMRGPAGEDIDPLNGAELRRVPSGPNPLHN
ncbi:hypothetical protein Nepgr_028051 [Nepenthes gracilis]|uniref:Uncharacterized protein n=1 Tax=Nepenthes gracilis TaxID=150966 RepID=A0AAD3T9Y3_NEPGR|nr:hypothetical protein Nepgr_028051 [Nepenthes gracilis]